MKKIANVLEEKPNTVMFVAIAGLLLLMLAAPLSASSATLKCQARLTDDQSQAQITCNADAPVSDQSQKTDAS